MLQGQPTYYFGYHSSFPPLLGAFISKNLFQASVSKDTGLTAVTVESELFDWYAQTAPATTAAPATAPEAIPAIAPALNPPETADSSLSPSGSLALCADTYSRKSATSSGDTNSNPAD